MANSAPSKAIRRLQQDLKELKENPIVRGNAEPLADDILTWYAIVIGAEGTPYSGIPIRFIMEFSNDYPNAPPKAYFETYIAYSAGVISKDAKGRAEVCLNIFGNYAQYHVGDWGTDASGWSPSYKVSTILVSMQALMMSDMISQRLDDIKRTLDSATSYKCELTGHDGSDQSKWFPQIIMDPKEAQEISLKYNRNYSTLRDFYVCYATGGEFNGENSIIGYGIQVLNAKSGTLSSPCEYISYTGFYSHNVTRSSTNVPILYWIPILIQPGTWNKIKPCLKSSIETIYDKIYTPQQPQNRRPPAPVPMFQKLFKICSSIMNSLVVEIMNNKGNLTANDKFINGYFAFYRLLAEVATDSPAFVNFCDENIRSFITNPKARTKDVTPNLGEFLIYLTISKKYTWTDIGTLFLEECDFRNVFWYTTGNRNQAPKYPSLKSVQSKDNPNREKLVFAATEVSRNLTMFQMKFSYVTKLIDLTTLVESFGLVSEDIRAELKQLYNKVIGIDNWEKYYEFLDITPVSSETRNQQLLFALKKSFELGYNR